MIDGHATTPASENCNVQLSLTSSPISVKPTEGVDSSNASYTSSSPQATVLESNLSSCLAGQSVSGSLSKDANITSPSGFVSSASVEQGGRDLFQSSENDTSSLLHGCRSAPYLQIPSQSMMTDESHGLSQSAVLIPHEESEAHSPRGTEADRESRSKDVPADVSMAKHLVSSTLPDPFAPDPTAGQMIVVADSVPDVNTPSKTTDQSAQNLVLTVNNHKPPDVTHGWGSSLAQNSEMVGSSPGSEFDSLGWGVTSAQKQEPRTLNVIPALAVQIPEQSTCSLSGSSIHNSAASFSAVDQAGNLFTPGISVQESVPSGNQAGSSTTKSSNWSMPSPTPPIKPSSWEVGPGTAIGSAQNNSFVPSDHQKPPMPGNQWETGLNIQPPAMPTPILGMGAAENADSTWRPTLENASTGWGPTPGNANTGWSGSAHGNINMGWGHGQGSTPQGNSNMALGPGLGSTPQGNANMGWTAPTANSSMWGSQQNHSGERFIGQGDRGFHGSDSGHAGGRPAWNRQPSFGSGGSSRLPPKGQQRVCKYHESGHCRKGASCDFLHT